MSYNKIIEELIEENEKLKEYLLSAEAMRDYWEIHSSELNEDIEKLKQSKKELYKWAYSLEKENKQLKEKIDYSDYVKASIFNDREEYKNKIVELKRENKKLDEEKSKLSDELTSKIRENYYQSLEINELRQELKEYRGF